MKRWTAPVLFALFTISACSDGQLDLERPGEHHQFQYGEADLESYRPDGATGAPVFAVDVSKWAAEVTDAEVACWHDAGVRHVVVGTQNYRVAKQQIEEALEGGMSVDAYVYLYWGVDWAERVQQDLEFLADYPIGRLWLDVEDHPGGHSIAQMEQKIQAGLDACGDTPCGIYTAGWWWKPHMRNSDTFSHVPLWHAYYDEDPDMTTWSEQHFGGWERPWGKQWTETYFCGPRLDKNTMFINAEPVAAPKTFEESDVLEAPTDLYPKDGMQIQRDFVRVLTDLVPGANRYDFQIESYKNGRWTHYFTFQSEIPAARFSPALHDRMYRFRVQAHRGNESSDWSYWSYFADGVVTEMPEVPSSAQPEAPASEDPAPEQPAPEDPSPEQPASAEPTPDEPPSEEPSPGPTNLMPADGSTLSNGSVVLTCDPVDGATGYEFEIEFWRLSGSWGAYFTYQDTDSSRLFYPQANRAYRWRVIAQTPEGEEVSNWSTFATGSGELP